MTIITSTYLLNYLILHTAHREDDITMWFFGVMRTDIPYVDLSMLILLTHIGMFFTVSSCILMYINYFKMKSGKPITELLYFLPAIVLIINLTQMIYYNYYSVIVLMFHSIVTILGIFIFMQISKKSG